MSDAKNTRISTRDKNTRLHHQQPQIVDDIDLIAKKWIKLQTRLAMLTKTAIEYGLEVNVGRSDRFWLEIAEKQHILN